MEITYGSAEWSNTRRKYKVELRRHISMTGHGGALDPRTTRTSHVMATNTLLAAWLSKLGGKSLMIIVPTTKVDPEVALAQLRGLRWPKRSTKHKGLRQ